MPRQTYRRTVAAALAETGTKFKLAEALALDIPMRGRGGNQVNPDGSVIDLIEEAREAIIAAGGEPKQGSTLNGYRLTALWVRGTDGRFNWVPGMSFTDHNRARGDRYRFADWSVNPVKVKQMNEDRGYIPGGISKAVLEAAVEAEIQRRLAEAKTEEAAREAVAMEVANSTARSRREAMRLYREATTTREAIELVSDASGPADTNLAHWATCVARLLDHNQARGFKPSDDTAQILRDLRDKIEEVL